MNAGETNEFEARYNARVAKIRKAAAIALKELDRLRSGGFVTQEVLDAEVTRIAREKLHPHGCDLACSPDGRWYCAFSNQGPGHWEKIRSNQKFFLS